MSHQHTHTHTHTHANINSTQQDTLSLCQLDTYTVAKPNQTPSSSSTNPTLKCLQKLYHGTYMSGLFPQLHHVSGSPHECALVF